MDYCRDCGAEVEDGVSLCPHCGTPIDSFVDPESVATDDALLREVWEIARTEGMISAVKRYREATGSDLAQAKRVVDGLLATGGAGEQFLAQRPPMEHLEAEVLDIARQQGKIAAIRRYREAQGCGLKEAKEAVEAMLTEHGVEPRAGSGCAIVLLLAFLGGGSLWSFV